MFKAIIYSMSWVSSAEVDRLVLSLFVPQTSDMKTALRVAIVGVVVAVVVVGVVVVVVVVVVVFSFFF